MSICTLDISSLRCVPFSRRHNSRHIPCGIRDRTLRRACPVGHHASVLGKLRTYLVSPTWRRTTQITRKKSTKGTLPLQHGPYVHKARTCKNDMSEALRHCRSPQCDNAADHTAALPLTTLRHCRCSQCNAALPLHHNAAMPLTTLRHCRSPHCGIAAAHNAAMPLTTLRYCRSLQCGTAAAHNAAMPLTTMRTLRQCR